MIQKQHTRVVVELASSERVSGSYQWLSSSLEIQHVWRAALSILTDSHDV